MSKKIAIIGTGYVGLTSGVCLASLGHKVICVDKDKDKIDKLKKGEIPIYEPGLAELLQKYSANLTFTDDLPDAVKQSEVIFLAVGTPSQDDGSVDLSFFQQAVAEIAQNMDGYRILVDKSTVPPGTANWVKKEVKKYYQGEFAVVSNPEFLREGSAIEDFLKPDRVVIGVDDEKAKDVMLDIYSAIDAPKFATTAQSAELIKYAANSFLAMKISFINEIANICEKTGSDVVEVAKGIGLDSRIGSQFLQAGVGFGGSCFSKDVAGLIHTALSNNYQPRILGAVMTVNEAQQEIFVDKIKAVLARNQGKVVGVWGLAFKPNTDDTRYSPAIAVIKKLLKEGYQVKAYDPVAQDNAKTELGEAIDYCKSAQEAAIDVDVLALLTDWPEFLEVDWAELKKIMRSPSIIDGRNFLPTGDLAKNGFHYQSIGHKFF